MSEYRYLRCPVCERVAPLLEYRDNDGVPVHMAFNGVDGLVLYACRRCVLTPGWDSEEHGEDDA